MTPVVDAPFCWPLGPDAALIPRTPLIADAYHELLVANHRRLAQWEPWAVERPEPDGTRTFLAAAAAGWLDGTQLPVAIAVPEGSRWRLVGSAGLRIDTYRASAEGGFWIDAHAEGRGLVTRTMTALIDHACGPLELGRITLRISVGNRRSRAVADRLGFVEEGLERQALRFGDERRDDVLFGLLATEWAARRPR